VGCAMFAPVALSAERVEEARLVDTRRLALDWVASNVPADASIVRETRTPPIEEFLAGRRVTPVRSVVMNEGPSAVRDAQYALISTGLSRIVRRSKDFERQKQLYEAFYAQHELVAEFAPERGVSSGPMIRVYRIRE